MRVKPTYHSQGRFVDVEVIIEEGERPRVASPLVYQAPNTPQLPYAEVAQAIVPDSFFDLFPSLLSALGVGRYDRKLTRERAAQLEQLLREEGYVSARVKALGESIEGDKVRPVIKLSLGSRLRVRFQGNASLSDEELSGELTFEESGVFDEVELEQSKRNIEQRYKSIAHYYAQVSASVEWSEGLITLTLHCDEGPQVYVGTLEIKGPSQLDVHELKGLMRLKGVAPRGVLSTLNASAGVFQEAALNQDLERLVRRYRAEGFSQVAFKCVHPEQASRLAWRAQLGEQAQERSGGSSSRSEVLWSTQVNQHTCFELSADHAERDKRRLLKVMVELREGERTTVDFVDVRDYLNAMDDSMRDDALELLRGMGFYDDRGAPLKGAGLSVEKLSLVEGVILRYLQRAGHLNASVKPMCELSTSKVVPCDLKALYGRSVRRLTVQVTPGPRARVEGVLMRGLLKTDPDLIKREVLLKRGDPLSTDALFLSQTNLRSLGLFRSVNIETIGLGEGPINPSDAQAQPSALSSYTNPVTMVVSVEESPPWQADALLGLLVRDTALSSVLSPDTLDLLYSTTLTVRHKNVGGEAWELGGGVSHDNLVRAPLDLQGDNTAWGVGPFLNTPRLFGSYTRLNSSVTFEQSLSAQRDSYVQRGVAQANISYDFYNLSFPSRWGKGLRVETRFEAKVERRRALSVDGERRDFGASTQSITLAPRLLYDQRDNPIHPTRGFYASVGVDGLFLPSELSTSLRQTLTAQWVTSLARQRLILAPSLRFGAVQSDQLDAQLPADFSFRAGGDGVPFPVRGYSDASIEACLGVETDEGSCSAVYEDNDFERARPARVGGRNLINMSFEARFPTLLIPDLWGGVFIDAAAVSTTLSELSLERLYPSVGAGLRWLVTGQIPVRLDVAYPLRATVFDPQRAPRLHINIFYTL